MYFCIHSSNILPTQETQQRQNRSRWELIKDALNKDFTNRSDLKARFAFFLYDLLLLCSCYMTRPCGGAIGPKFPEFDKAEQVHTVSYFLISFALLILFFFFNFVTECHIEIQCLKRQEMGLHCIKFVLHSGK